MRKARNIISAVFGLCILSACAQEVDVAYYCEPSGAKIYQEGLAGGVGTCPMTAKYSMNGANVKDGQLHTNKLNVVWPSGASLLVRPMTLDIPPDYKTSLTFTRPADFPGENKDQAFSTTFDESLRTPEVKYVVSSHQNKDFFDALNRNTSCLFTFLIQSVDAQCP